MDVFCLPRIEYCSLVCHAHEQNFCCSEHKNCNIFPQERFENLAYKIKLCLSPHKTVRAETFITGLNKLNENKTSPRNELKRLFFLVGYAERLIRSRVVLRSSDTKDWMIQQFFRLKLYTWQCLPPKYFTV